MNGTKVQDQRLNDRLERLRLALEQDWRHMLRQLNLPADYTGYVDLRKAKQTRHWSTYEARLDEYHAVASALGAFS